MAALTSLTLVILYPIVSNFVSTRIQQNYFMLQDSIELNIISGILVTGLIVCVLCAIFLRSSRRPRFRSRREHDADLCNVYRSLHAINTIQKSKT